MKPPGRSGTSTTLFGSLDLPEQVLVRLEQNLPRLGLELKVLLMSSLRPEDSHFPHLAEVTHIGIRHESKGFKVLRVPMGGCLCVKKALEETAEKVAQFSQPVAALDHPQTGFIIFFLQQCCGTCRVVHLLRALDTEESSALVETDGKTPMDSALPCVGPPVAA